MVKSIKHSKGAATLIICVALLLAIGLLIFIGVKANVRQMNIFGANYASMQSFEAAAAGLNYGVIYLKDNKSSILVDNNGDGYIDPYTSSSTQNVQLSDGSTYSISYTNPIVNNLKTVKVTVTGLSADGTAKRIISQLVTYATYFGTPPISPVIAKGAVSLTGNTTITNSVGGTTIMSGQTTTLNGSATTVVSGGVSSTSSALGSDVTQNDTSLAGTTDSQLFFNTFNMNEDTLKQNVAIYYQNSTDTQYASLLNGLANTSIWIEQTGGLAEITSNSTIGTSTNPVLLIVNGNLTIKGNVTINGFLYVSGNLDQSAGTAIINGAVVVGGTFTSGGNLSVNYLTDTLNLVESQDGAFARVPGSWTDF